MQAAIQQGLPEVGWSGDPLLTLTFNRRAEQWEVLDRAVTPPVRVLAKKAEGLRDLDVRALCTRLRKAQVPRDGGATTIYDRMNARQLAIEEESRKEMADLSLATALALQDTAFHRRTFLL